MFKFSASPEFLQQFQRGDRSALERVYFAYVEEVEVFLRRFLARCGRAVDRRADLGDLVQETFVRAFSDRARTAFDGSREFGPFLGTLTRNLAIDWARKHGRELLSEELDQYAAADLETDLDDWADRGTMAAVSDYLAELPAELRDIHEHRFVHCRTQAETCAALGVSRQQLRTREKTLRDGLRRRLKRLELAVGGTSVPKPTP